MSKKDKTTGFIAEFKQFIARGNVIDMAVGVVIGSAFGKITTSLVNDIIMPLISMITGGIDFSEWKWVLKEAVIENGEEVSAAVSVNYGSLISTILDFIIIACVIFCLIKGINKFHRKKDEPEAPPAPPEPSTEEKLLTEIRDLLAKK
jgi:large conductance mechanosensitive channel